ncbi:GPALPP motifs-containing protein 1-like [Paramacrobiotus metropolitanus]|uniref:GPALPP motifs-containing protein 1-like n=1 Tax=Paramacrobiotus metropolitanus TaxID=2943436 RepID=UPI002445E507|nr:GPALPP motifs-containing protein 1-like [Paramacrobiotus metropolitanus]
MILICLIVLPLILSNWYSWISIFWNMANYGPQLPPGFNLSNESNAESDRQKEHLPVVDEDDHSGHEDKKKVYGPVLPPGIQTKSSADETQKCAPIIIGPVIPSTALTINSTAGGLTEIKAMPKKVIGPTLPPGLFTDSTKSAEDNLVGSDDDDLVGPSASLMAAEGDYSAADEVSRRYHMHAEKKRKANEPVQVQREEWMTDLPEALLGRNSIPTMPTGPRTFKRRADEYEADFSGWTAGPDGKHKKSAGKSDDTNELRYHQAVERERKLEQEITQHNKDKRGESLVSMAQKDKKQVESTGRREFDRERDLGIRKVTKLDQDEVSKRAAALRDRFSSSGTSGQKYL